MARCGRSLQCFIGTGVYESGASEWIAMNVLSLTPELVVIEQSQVPLMRLLERHGIQSLPIRLRHMRTLGGGPHCVTLDLVREGELADYR